MAKKTGKVPAQKNLAATNPSSYNSRTLSWTPKSIYRTRLDVQHWNTAYNMANNVEEPYNYLLQLIYDEIRLDALLTSQIENRKQQVFSAKFSLKHSNGEIDEEQTNLFANSAIYKAITDAILETRYVGYNMIELSIKEKKGIDVTVIPRTNYVPKVGLFYKDYLEANNPIKYRELPEFGKWILEFRNSEEFGLLNKAVPHVLFKRFAQSCWSELCEIYGIPPRVMKTNTQDPNMLNRAEKMMRDMGAASWFIIDETEAFEFAAQAGNLNGDVYNNLITLCNNENSLLVSGAIIGQDTVNGNRSKEESSQNMLWQLVQADMKMVETEWNVTVLPALAQIGIMPPGLTFEFSPEEDIQQLFEFTKGLLPFKDVDNEWLKEKFGVDVKDKPTTLQPTFNEEEEKIEKAIEKKLSVFFG